MRVLALFALAVVVLATTVSAANPFACQQTVDVYNSYVKIGEVAMAANLTFTDNVTYVVPGPISPGNFTGPCPFCNTYVGKDAVVSLFTTGFLGSFTFVNPVVNLRSMSTGMSMAKSPRFMDFKQESFVTNPAKTVGGVPRYFSLPVIHDFLFDFDCKIQQMVLLHDPYTVTRVYSGFPANVAPAMPFVVFDAPPTSFRSVQNVSDFQIFPGESAVAPAAAKRLVSQYYRALSAGNGSLSPNATAKFFMALNFSVPQAMAALLVPGDTTVVPFAGMFMGVAQIAQAHALRAATVIEQSPLADPAAAWIVDGGSVSVKYRLQGKAIATGLTYSCTAVDYFQVFSAFAAGPLRIGRLTRFYDTHNVTSAVTPSS